MSAFALFISIDADTCASVTILTMKECATLRAGTEYQILCAVLYVYHRYAEHEVSTDTLTPPDARASSIIHCISMHVPICYNGWKPTGLEALGM